MEQNLILTKSFGEEKSSKATFPFSGKLGIIQAMPSMRDTDSSIDIRYKDITMSIREMPYTQRLIDHTTFEFKEGDEIEFLNIKNIENVIFWIMEKHK